MFLNYYTTINFIPQLKFSNYTERKIMINMKVTIIMFLVVNYLSTQSVGKRMVFQNGKWKFVGKLPENATITVFHNF